MRKYWSVKISKFWNVDIKSSPLVQGGHPYLNSLNSWNCTGIFLCTWIVLEKQSFWSMYLNFLEFFLLASLNFFYWHPWIFLLASLNFLLWIFLLFVIVPKIYFDFFEISWKGKKYLFPSDFVNLFTYYSFLLDVFLIAI